MKSLVNNKSSKLISENYIYIILILLVGFITIVDHNFLSVECLKNIIMQSSPKLIIALGAAFVLISGGVDLSAGRIVGLAAVLSASLLQRQNYTLKFFPGMKELPIWLPIIITITICMIIGALNGLIISKFKVPPFITTLGTMGIVFGINSKYYDVKPNHSQPIAGLRDSFTKFGTGSVEGIPIIFLIALLITIFAIVMFNKTRLGKNMYAIGGNEEAAKVSGVNLTLNLTIIYAIAGALYAIAGLLYAAKTASATNNDGLMFELHAIAACVVGGVSTKGGVGKIKGIIGGVLIFNIIDYGLSFLGVIVEVQYVIQGLIIITAVAIDRIRDNNK